MIKDLLIDIQTSLDYVANDLPATTNFAAKKLISNLVIQDLARLSLNDPTFLDGPNGYVDYYSPHAELQLKNKKDILEKYLEKLYLLQASLFCIYQKNEKSLLT